jgi:hypothetical protein
MSCHGKYAVVEIGKIRSRGGRIIDMIFERRSV